MYIPKLYRQDDKGIILDFLRQNSFPALVSSDGGTLTATHTPVEVAGDGPDGWVIYGHLSRANPQWRTFGDQDVLLIFQGAHTYISPRWYSHVNVPTWNYMMVHVYGKVRLVDGDELRALLGRLVDRHEANTAYSLDGLPPDFVQKEMNGVVGFAVAVSRVEAGYKLSQNRSDPDHANIIRELEERGDEASAGVAQAMRENRAPSRGG